VNVEQKVQVCDATDVW